MIESLALNMAGIPMDIISWKKAITLWSLGRAVIISEYEDKIIRSPRFSMHIPSIIQCVDMRVMPRNFTNRLPFNRRNILARDHGVCVYCGQKVTLASFTIDHVIPRSHGGETSWENVVSSCTTCNNRKGNKRWKAGELKMLHQPYAPKLTKAAPRNLVNKLSFKTPHQSWTDYIYWRIALMA
jgi:5-methylcytosine-specific restriction endonuclease McrA